MDRAKLVVIAGDLFKQHGLDVRGWRLDLRNCGRRLGWCCSRRLVIALDSFFSDHNEETPVIDTLLHEIAHAIVGPALGHGPVWKAMALRLGCNPQARGKTDILVRPGRYQATCPTCARIFNMYRRPRHAIGYYCPSCGSDHGQVIFTAQAAHCASDAVSSARVPACPE